MTPTDDRFMYGVDGSTVSGTNTGIIIVDDPHGYVVPCADVQIISHQAVGYLWHRMSQLRGDVLDRMAPEPRHGKSNITIAKVQEETPRIKCSKPKVRKLAKGLRP